MDPAIPTGCCGCGCPHCSAPATLTYRRSVKRKADPDGRDVPPLAGSARVEVENELAALRETLASQQGAIQELSVELEEERNAAASAASETMSMILRLQREKAEVQMEARQFRRFAEEKMAHDGHEIADLEDLLFKREQEVQALSCEVRAYKHRFMSLGVDVGSDPISLNSYVEDEFDLPGDEGYPSLRCYAADSCDDEAADIERRIYVLEKTPTNPNVLNPPLGNLRRFSAVNSSLMPQDSSEIVDKNRDEEDDETDRIYTIDAVHGVAIGRCSGEEELDSSRVKEGSDQKGGLLSGETEGDIKKLYMRLQALEADRESMRQAIISMRTEKAQLVLLREIAQQLCKEVKPEKRVVKKNPSLFGEFSFMSLIKWVMPFLFWRKKAPRSRYTFGSTNGNVGLLQILDKSSWMGQCRYLTRTTTRCQ